ncbi:hypothetical protein ACXDF8_16535 [Mycolicibacterium sp. CBM1]
MRRALAPFLTTGVALVAAAVVVANPVTPASRDMQISTTQLSTSPGLLTPFDKSLLNAMTPQTAIDGIGPALAQILAALAADADRIGREVNLEVAPDGAAVAALPEQSGYHPEPLAPPAVDTANTTVVSSATGFGPSIVSTGVEEALSGLVADTSYLGGKVVEAAFAAVDVIIRVPQSILVAVVALLNGNLSGALDTVRSVVTDFFGPGLIIIGGILDVLKKLPPLVAAAVPAAATVEQDSGTSADAEQSGTSTTATTATATEPADAAKPRPSAPSRSGSGTSLRTRLSATAPGSARPSSAAATPTTEKPSSSGSDTTPAPAAAPSTGASGKPAAGSARAHKAAKTSSQAG